MTNTALYQCWLSAGISLSGNKRMKRRRGEADKEQDKSHRGKKKIKKRRRKKKCESEIIEKNMIKTQCGVR